MVKPDSQQALPPPKKKPLSFLNILHNGGYKSLRYPIFT